MIRVLEKNVADKIAAGEVIDRPVSIVKELVENSIDAGADSITVEIRNGGKSYIRVTDNGCGIEESDVENAFKRHATSKISNVEDLDDIGTLGFRGEALASICAVSRVELITKTMAGREGTSIVVEESQVKSHKSTGCPEGTTITVRDLFFNLPARLKFLSSDASETRRITDMMSRIALSYPDVRVSLISGGKNIFTSTGKGNILNNIINIYGADTGKFLIPVSAEDGDMILKGFISNPSRTLSSGSKQIFAVNGRVISSNVMKSALEAGYRERLMHGRFPIAFLFLCVPGSTLDVNIHPAKREIRFNDNGRIEDFISEAVAKALKSDEGVSRAVISQKPHDEIQEKVILETNAPVNIRKNVSEKKEQVVRKKEQKQEQVNIKQVLSSIKRKPEVLEEISGFEEEKSTYNVPFDFDSLSVIGTLFNTYILTQNEGNFFMIDQHAAHERIFYEQMKNQYMSSEKASQQLIAPINISVSSDSVACEESWIPAVTNMGYTMEYFGNNNYLVREIPAFISLEDAEAFLRDFISSAGDNLDPTDKRAIDRIITRACKASVKGGDVLHTEEAVSLINRLKKCENPFSCPHGRPTFVKMSKYEIEKMFKRV